MFKVRIHTWLDLAWLYVDAVCVDGGDEQLTQLTKTPCEYRRRRYQTLERGLCPSQALPRVNTFIPADDEHLTAMVEEGKDDFEDWLDTPAEWSACLHGRKRHKRYSIEIDRTSGFHR